VKKLMLLAAGLVASVFFAGCSTTAQQNLTALAAQAQTNAVHACAVIQPTLLDLSASIPSDPNLALLAQDNGKLCAAVANLDPSNVQSLVNTVIPQAIGLVSLLPIDSGTQVTIRLALGAASIALSNWLAVYGTPAATVPATAPAASGVSA